MRLEPDQAVDDVGAGVLQLARPDDVGLLVEAGLDLDQDDDLLAALGRADEGLDDRRIAGRPIEGHLDREDVRIVGGLGDEPLDGRGERFVRVMDEDVARADRGEDVGRLVLVRRHESGWGDRRPRLGAEFGPIEVGDPVQRRQVEHPGDLVAVVRREAEAAQQQRAGRRWHRALDLESDRLAEAPPSKLLLDGHQQVVGLVLLDREVRIAGHPEQVRLDDLHAGEQVLEVGGDHLVDRHEALGFDLEQARQDLRHLDPGEDALAGLRIAQADGDRQAERRDVRERVARIDRERRQDREDLVVEPLSERVMVLGDLVVVEDLDPLGRQLPAEFDEDRRVLGDQAEDPFPGRGQLLGGGQAVRRPGRCAGLDLLAQARDPDLEELVEVAREDGQRTWPAPAAGSARPAPRTGRGR